jgi:transposase
MRFVETKTPEQQSCLMLHRTRHLFIRQQTSVINAIRAHLAEFGIVAPVGRNGVEELLNVSPIQLTSGCRRLRERVSLLSGLSCEGSRSKFWDSIAGSWPGTDQTR